MTTKAKYLRGVVVCGLLAISALVTPARAGTGPSTACSDGPFQPPGTEVPILTSPITVGAEVGRLGSTSPYVQVCFSTTATGSGSAAVIGGWVQATLDPTNPRVVCDKDTSPIVLGLDCEIDSNTIWISLVIQGTPIQIGIGYGLLDNVVCLRDVVVTTPTSSTPPLDIGVCD